MKKLTLATIVGLGLMSGSALAASAWTGGDDLPTNPLSCDATPAAAVAAPYDGGVPTNPPDRKGKKITVVDVPKLIGIDYFNATSKGITDAAAELGNVDAKTDGPTKANIDEQITFLDNYITSGVDGILFAANDPVAIAPVLKKALEKGINVVGYDANSTPDARQWFVNQAQFNGIAKALVDNMATEAGEDAGVAIVTSTFTTPNQARWIAEMAAYAEKCHPKMKWLETVEAQEDNNLSFNQATALINKHGDKLAGLFGMTSVATPAGLTQAASLSSTTGDDASMIMYYQIQTTATSISAGSMVVTGGISAISKAYVAALPSDMQTLTLTRSVNTVVKAHSRGEALVLHPDYACYLGL